jgi:hypothetical protein
MARNTSTPPATARLSELPERWGFRNLITFITTIRVPNAFIANTTASALLDD